MLRALGHIRRMRGGAQSHLMRCSDGHYYVVKFQNNPQHMRILVNELLATRLAARLGLPTTPVAMVEVSPELIGLTPELCVELPRARVPCTPAEPAERCARHGSRTRSEPPVCGTRRAGTGQLPRGRAGQPRDDAQLLLASVAPGKVVGTH